MDKSAGAFRTISEVADDLDVPQHVLRFWETRFTQIKPLKRAGGRRFYRPDDVALLQAIRQLLYGQGYTIKGVQRILKEQGVRAVLAGHVGAPTDAAERAPSTPEVEAMSDFADAAADEISGESLETQSMSAAHAAVLEAILADLAECQHMLDVARR